MDPFLDGFKCNICFHEIGGDLTHVKDEKKLKEACQLANGYIFVFDISESLKHKTAKLAAETRAKYIKKVLECGCFEKTIKHEDIPRVFIYNDNSMCSPDGAQRAQPAESAQGAQGAMSAQAAGSTKSTQPKQGALSAQAAGSKQSTQPAQGAKGAQGAESAQCADDDPDLCYQDQAVL